MRIEKLNKIINDLSKIEDPKKIMDRIILGLQKITHSDGVVFYRIDEDNLKLKFEYILHQSLNISRNIGNRFWPYQHINLYDPPSRPNIKNVVGKAIHSKEIINNEDIYLAEGMDFYGIKRFDKVMGHRTCSLLTIPLFDFQGDTIGAVQLMNPLDSNSKCTGYTDEDIQVVELLASLLGMLYSNVQLNREMRGVFESFAQVLASAIDEKSPYTGGHCRRVPIIALMIADALTEVDYGPLKDFKLTKEERYELELGALLHDCGKVTTPVHIMDKATKLETIFDRVEMVDMRTEIIMRDKEIELLKQEISLLKKNSKEDNTLDFNKIEKSLNDFKKELINDRNFVHRSNLGGEYMPKEQQDRIREISTKYKWNNPYGKKENYLNNNEVENLLVSRGTLNWKERDIINQHVSMTIKMLSKIKFPKGLKRIPEIAGCHHEQINGKGYPMGLHGSEMSVQARLMGIADIFEALTAKDRPYKRGKPLSETLDLMGKMRVNGHIDGEIFDIFLDKKLYNVYAKKYLDSYQMDVDSPDKVPGYREPAKRLTTSKTQSKKTKKKVKKKTAKKMGKKVTASKSKKGKSKKRKAA